MTLAGELIVNRPRLLGLAYRMLGTITDAEDVLQEAYLRVEKVDAATVRDPAAYLVSVVTNLAIDQLRSSQRRREEYFGPWLPEPVATDRGGEDEIVAMEAISFGFLLALEQLDPVERAVFVLHDLFNYSYREIAEIVAKSESNCRQIASRARRRLPSGDVTLGRSGPAEEELLAAFLRAIRTGDVMGLQSLLSADVGLVTDGGGQAQALPKPVSGSQLVARLLLTFVGRTPADTPVEIREINGGPGLVVGSGDDLLAVLSFEVRGKQISRIRIVANPAKFRLEWLR